MINIYYYKLCYFKFNSSIKNIYNKGFLIITFDYNLYFEYFSYFLDNFLVIILNILIFP